MIMWQTPVLVVTLGYVLGSVPWGLLLTRLFGAGDLRQIGSGNIGATNVLRTGRKELAAATLLLDIGKGALAVWLGTRIMGQGPLDNGGAIAGVMAFIGHCYPIWLRFAGGKGVATMMGVAVALAWPVGLVFALLWIGMIAATRISSAGGITAAIGAPVAAYYFDQVPLIPPITAMTLILLWRHRANMARLIRGHEPRIGGRSD